MFDDDTLMVALGLLVLWLYFNPTSDDGGALVLDAPALGGIAEPPSPAHVMPPDGYGVVKQIHADYVARGGTFNTFDEIFQGVTLPVALALKGDGAGLAKDEHSSDTYWNGIRVSAVRILYPTGTLIKVIGDSGPADEGNSNFPEWLDDGVLDRSAYLPL